MSSFRYGFNSKEYQLITEYVKEKNVQQLNHLLISSKSISSKLVILSFLDDFKDESSIKLLITLLDYDIPLWDKLDSETPNPVDVRYGSFEVIIEYKYDEVVGYLPKERGKSFKDLYFSAIKTFYGDKVARERILSYKNVAWAKDDYYCLTKFLKIE